MGHNSTNHSNNANNHNKRISGNEMRMSEEHQHQQRQNNTGNDRREDAPDMAMQIIHGDDMHSNEKGIEKEDDEDEDITIIVEDEGKDIEDGVLILSQDEHDRGHDHGHDHDRGHDRDHDHEKDNNEHGRGHDGHEREEFDYEMFRTQFRRQMREENYEECERLCRSAIGKNLPNLLRAKVYNCLGYLYENCMEDKLFDDILEKYVLSLQLDNDNANAHYNLGNFLVEQGIQHLAQAIQLNPTHSKALSLFEALQHGIAGGHVVCFFFFFFLICILSLCMFFFFFLSALFCQGFFEYISMKKKGGDWRHTLCAKRRVRVLELSSETIRCERVGDNGNGNGNGNDMVDVRLGLRTAESQESNPQPLPRIGPAMELQPSQSGPIGGLPHPLHSADSGFQLATHLTIMTHQSHHGDDDRGNHNQYTTANTHAHAVSSVNRGGGGRIPQTDSPFIIFRSDTPAGTSDRVNNNDNATHNNPRNDNFRINTQPQVHFFPSKFYWMWPLLAIFAIGCAIGGASALLENYYSGFDKNTCSNKIYVTGMILILPLIVLTTAWTIYLFYHVCVNVRHQHHNELHFSGVLTASSPT
ncbi:hypothetical protein RFI_20277 [Reticulomyxa filosa]|uniref:Uncharacterized protein n=1 Tax=Reticulomyxa filosa TaxID=46433 RepID=X6MTR8_RETFI|nr:hypothetical protein RFI_20277 [Reticulomyxa filosa]|eukprot:ETO17056.1 hypothetical protein RFI_20277 [Reticulomyxa filosa]